MAKITMLGAGSAFTAGIMRDIMLIPELKQGEIRLVDIDAKRLRITSKLVDVLAQRMNKELGTRWTMVSSIDRRKVLKGSDYIINCIEVSGVKTVALDNDIPSKYGIDQCIGDTIGPGGIFKALRTVPAWLEILDDIERYCPDALVMNYTNPMSIMILAAVRSSPARIVGLCHSVQGTSRKMASVAEVPYEKMAFKCAGINHLAWLTELSHNGRDLYPKIIRRAQTEKDIYESDPVRFEMMFQFGAFVSESSGHLSEYVPYFRKRKDLIKEYCRDGYRGGTRFYASSWPQWRQNKDNERNMLIKDITKMDLTRGLEYASEIIEAHMLNRPKVIYGSVINKGLISNLPGDGVVEVATLVDNTGFNPCRFGALPAAMAGLCESNMRVFDLVVRGIINRDRDAIYHAMMLDPLSSAVCSPSEIRSMTDEMVKAESAFIPSFMRHGHVRRVKSGAQDPVVRRMRRKAKPAAIARCAVH